MASSYKEQLQDCVSPSAASHPIRSQPVNNVRYSKQIQVCTSPRVASRPRSGNQPGGEDASNNTNEWIVVGKKGSNRIDSTTKAAPKVEVHNAYSILKEKLISRLMSGLLCGRASRLMSQKDI